MSLRHIKQILSVLVVVWIASSSCLPAATPPSEKLLPSSTLAVVAIPEFNRVRTAGQHNANWLFLQDPAMKPVVDKFVAKWQSDVVARFEQQFGIKLADYKDLAQGQITLAWLTPGEEAKENSPPPFVFLLDSGEKAEQLKKVLEDFRKKWVDSGKQLKPEKIRGVEFVTLMFSSDDLEKVLEKSFPAKKVKEDDDDKDKDKDKDSSEKKEPPAKLEWLLGQSESLLVLGNSASQIEKVLSLQAGGSGGSLSEVGGFSAYRDAMFRDATAYAWLNLQDGIGLLKKSLASSESGRRRGGDPSPSPLQMLQGLGLDGLRAGAFSSHTTPEGVSYDLRISVPEADRKGLLKMLSFDAKDAGPPSFVPADVLTFSRTRIDLLKAVETLEATVTQMFPQSASLIKLFMDTTGKDKDPNFDLRKNLFGNLGDDYISYSKPARDDTPVESREPRSIHLIGARDADQLANALKTLTAFLPPQAGKKDREFLGRKVFTVTFPGAQQSVSFTASGGYLVISTDDAMLEEYLRSSDAKGKPLREISGLSEDSQKVKGMGLGLFGYVNGVETMRTRFEAIKKDPGAVANMIASLPIASRLGLDDDAKALKDWVDFSSFPSFDQVSQYFHYTIYSGAFNSDGFEMSFSAPTPPKLKK